MPPANAGHASRRDAILDAWRGLSVLLVVASHGLVHLELAEPGSVPYSLVEPAGALGVRFFFVISGYIITRLLLEEHAAHGRICVPAFYVRRAFRILPPLWLVLAVTAGVHAAGLIADPSPYWGAAAFLCNTGRVPCHWFVGHLWTLAVEEQFYLAWPLMLTLILKTGSPSGARTAAAGAMIVFLLLAQLSVFTIGWLNNGLAFACIAAGAWYATSPRLQRAVDRAATLPALVLAALFLLGRPLIPLYFPGQYRLQDLATPLLLAFLVFGSFRHRAQLERRIGVRMLAAVGVVSYGLYLWQQLFLAPAELYPVDSWLRHWPLFALVALVSWFGLERPLMQLGHRLSRSMTGAQAGQAPLREPG